MPDLVRVYSPGERDVLQAERLGKPPQFGVERPSAGERERGAGISILDESECAKRARQVVERLEIPRGQHARLKAFAMTESESFGVDDVGNDFRRDPEAGKHLVQES